MTPVDAHERRSSFCTRLKDERQRRDIPLDAIASTTKVKASLLEALERGDLSRWPKGLYRRAFFRDYAAAIGLPADSLVVEFLELFPDGEERPVAAPTRPATAPVQSPLRLTYGGAELQGGVLGLGTVRRPGWLVVRQQALAAAADLAIVLGVVALAWLMLSASPWAAAAIVASTYYSLGTMLFGQTPAARWLGGRPWKAQPPSTPSPAEAPAATMLDVGARAPTGAIARGGIEAVG